jgi:zinc/manganese transport system permease protein
MIAIDFLLLPFIACFLLGLINVYFGIHVIKREIIFIDIALAQIAALGSAVAMVIFVLIHPEVSHEQGHNNAFTYLFSLGFITLAALMFTFLKNKKISIPLEAAIGISYAVAATGAVIILDKGAGGDVHVHDMLIGSILWVSWHNVTQLFIVVVMVGTFHIVFRRKFIPLTDTYQNKNNVIRNSQLWDFLFYFTFGIVIIEAVNIAGILTVFAFLILPASISTIFAVKWWSKIWIGWIICLLTSSAGLYISWKMDIACSPVIIVFLGILLVLSIMTKRLFFLPELK